MKCNLLEICQPIRNTASSHQALLAKVLADITDNQPKRFAGVSHIPKLFHNRPEYTTPMLLLPPWPLP